MHSYFEVEITVTVTQDHALKPKILASTYLFVIFSRDHIKTHNRDNKTQERIRYDSLKPSNGQSQTVKQKTGLVSLKKVRYRMTSKTHPLGALAVRILKN